MAIKNIKLPKFSKKSEPVPIVILSHSESDYAHSPTPDRLTPQAATGFVGSTSMSRSNSQLRGILKNRNDVGSVDEFSTSRNTKFNATSSFEESMRLDAPPASLKENEEEELDDGLQDEPSVSSDESSDNNSEIFNMSDGEEEEEETEKPQKHTKEHHHHHHHHHHYHPSPDSSVSSLDSDFDRSIYGPSERTRQPRHTARQPRQPARPKNLIHELEDMDEDAVTTDNEALLSRFQKFDYRYIDWEDLTTLLVDPGTGRHFKDSTCKRLAAMHSASGHHKRLNFKAFVHMCVFLKDCTEVYTQYRRSSHEMGAKDFHAAMKSQGLKCPSKMWQKLFKYDDYVSCAGFIGAVLVATGY